METLSALLALCKGINRSLVDSPHNGTAMWNVYGSHCCQPNNLLNKRSSYHWFETLCHIADNQSFRLSVERDNLAILIMHMHLYILIKMFLCSNGIHMIYNDEVIYNGDQQPFLYSTGLNSSLFEHRDYSFWPDDKNWVTIVWHR